MSAETTGTSLIDIHQSFAETELGTTLAARVRYERFKPTDTSNERWEELLGADVNNLKHLALTYGLTRSMVRHLRINQPGLLNAHEEKVLLVTALIHDWAEAIVGDISYSDKTEEQEAEEMEHLFAILDQRYSDEDSDIRSLVLEAAGVVRAPETKLGKIFNTIERVGYIRTGLNAAEHIVNGTAPDCEEGLRWIVAEVIGNHLPTLIDRSFDYVPVDLYLRNQQDSIDQAFSQVTDETFMYYPPEQQQAEQDEFITAFKAWELWPTDKSFPFSN